MQAQYSNLERTRDIYESSLRLLGQYLKFLFRNPRVEFALFVMTSVWVNQFSSDVNVTPKWFALFTSSMISTPPPPPPPPPPPHTHTHTHSIKFGYGLTWPSKKHDITFGDVKSHTALFDTLRPRNNGRHFADDIFKCIFLNENVFISIKISLKFVPKGQINNIPALVKIMAWRRPGDKPLSELMMVSLLTHICVTRSQWVKVVTVSQEDEGVVYGPNSLV